MIELSSRIAMRDLDAYRRTVPALWYSAMAVRMALGPSLPSLKVRGTGMYRHFQWPIRSYMGHWK